MNCEFEHLYFADDGYVIRCKHCCHYQVAFMTTLLNITEADYCTFMKIVADKYAGISTHLLDECKSIIIKTPLEGMYIILTPKETEKLYNMLDAADSESQSRSLIDMFYRY